MIYKDKIGIFLIKKVFKQSSKLVRSEKNTLQIRKGTNCLIYQQSSKAKLILPTVMIDLTVHKYLTYSEDRSYRPQESVHHTLHIL